MKKFICITECKKFEKNEPKCQDVKFESYDLGETGKLTREEIYEDIQKEFFHPNN